MSNVATRPQALNTNTAARLLEIWLPACNSTARDPFVGLEDRVHAEVLSILAKHAVEPTVEQQRTLRWLARWEVTTVINMVELIVSRCGPSDSNTFGCGQTSTDLLGV